MITVCNKGYANSDLVHVILFKLQFNSRTSKRLILNHFDVKLFTHHSLLHASLRLNSLIACFFVKKMCTAFTTKVLSLIRKPNS